MLGITPFGMFHTVISLIAVLAAVVALIRDKQISPRNMVGKVYVAMTIASCVTGFFIFEHGGFGKPHALGVLTLLLLGVAAVAGYSSLLGRASPYVETVAYTTTFFFHMIPGFTESLTRLPAGGPWATSPEDPLLQPIIGAVFVVFVIGAVLQVRRLKRARPARTH